MPKGHFSCFLVVAVLWFHLAGSSIKTIDWFTDIFHYLLGGQWLLFKTEIKKETSIMKTLVITMWSCICVYSVCGDNIAVNLMMCGLGNKQPGLSSSPWLNCQGILLSSSSSAFFSLAQSRNYVVYPSLPLSVHDQVATLASFTLGLRNNYYWL